MNTLPLPISEADISLQIGRTIKSPIWIASLADLAMDQTNFLDHFSGFFEELAWDPYDPRRLRIEFLKEAFPADHSKIDQLFKAYYTGEIKLTAFQAWIDQLTDRQQQDFDQIKPWRRRSVAQFMIQEEKETIRVTRTPIKQFTQGVDSNDVRSWPRVFDESPAKHVENEPFELLLQNIFKLTQKVYPNIQKIKAVAHFMSVQATKKTPGNNSPEGAHEDGSDFIISALVINRINIGGGKSQIIEKLADGTKEVIYAHTLQPGEFVFQADTGEEKIYGNDLWHHITPFHIEDDQLGEAWRDIIGFDIDIV